MNQSIKKNINKIKNKTIFLRVDFNVPIEKNKVIDEKKIIATLPTIRYLLRYNCKLILATHLGRPNGRFVKKYSTEVVAKRLNKILGAKKVKFIKNKYKNNEISEEIKENINKLKNGNILFLENLRFSKGEKENNTKFAKNLASLADIYINEAFSVSHRKHASISAIKKYLPSFRGLLLETELKNLDKVRKPQKPLIVIMGGSKIETKINLIKNLERKATKILIGGALANNFFKARKFEVGKSLIDGKSINLAKKLKNKKIILPTDVIVSKTKTGKNIKIKKISEIQKSDIILDIGPETIKKYAAILKTAKTIIWNGPMGYFEENKFKYGTVSLGQIIASRSDEKAFTVVGGGETLSALKLTKMEDYINWVSTGGGAMLAYLGGKKMPGLL